MMRKKGDLLLEQLLGTPEKVAKLHYYFTIGLIGFVIFMTIGLLSLLILLILGRI
jgi:hypothetical protein